MFSFKEFILRIKEETPGILEEYKMYVKEDLLEIDSFYDTRFYKDYLIKFEEEKINFILNCLRKPYSEEFDYKMLLLLILGSYSNKWYFDIVYGNKVEISLLIKVESNNRSVSKRLEDLFGYQIYSMFIIYLKEQIQITTISYEDKKERMNVFFLRKNILKHFNKEYERVKLLCEAIR